MVIEGQSIGSKSEAHPISVTQAVSSLKVCTARELLRLQEVQ